MTVFDRLRQLEANATPGPWRYRPDQRDIIGTDWFIADTMSHGDATFIVAARNLWGPLVTVASAAAEADDLLRRLSEWDMLSSYEGKPVTADGPYWQVEIARVRDALTALAALEQAVKEQP